MRVLQPAEGVYAFYDGRIDGYRFAEGPNWVDDGALSLGIASYAVVHDREAIVYDTHTSRSSTPATSASFSKARACGASRSSSATGTSITSPAPPSSLSVR